MSFVNVPWIWMHHRVELVAVLAAGELFVLQQLTLPASENVTLAASVAGALARLGLNVAFFAFVLRSVRPRFRAVVLAAQCIFGIAALSYHAYYHQPWSIPASLRMATEIATVGTTFLQMASHEAVAASVGLLVLKLLLLGRDKHGMRLGPPRPAFWVGAASLGIGVMAVGPGNLAHPGALAQAGFALGYAVPSVAEALHGTRELVLARAVERASEEIPPIPRQPVLPLGDRVLVIQVESLDARLLGAEYRGREVTPFLNDLRRRSVTFEVNAIHLNGSADADFALLMARRPSVDTLNYLIDGFPYEGALPAELNRCGWRTEAVHGVTGRFFRRRPAFAAMGFDRTFFVEELRQAGLPEGVAWGLDDGPVLHFAAERLLAQPGPTLVFVITFSAHTPHRWTPSDAPKVVPDPQPGAEMLMNAIHYTDRELGRLYQLLPPGTTLVIYGDHAVPHRHPVLAEPEAIERIPVLVHRVGTDLPAQQKPARDGRGDLLGIAAWLRSSLLEPCTNLKKGPVR